MKYEELNPLDQLQIDTALECNPGMVVAINGDGTYELIHRANFNPGTPIPTKCGYPKSY